MKEGDQKRGEGEEGGGIETETWRLPSPLADSGEFPIYEGADIRKETPHPTPQVPRQAAFLNKKN